MRDVDHRLINQIKKAHAMVTDKIMGMMIVMNVPPTEIRHIFTGAYDDEYILYGAFGFHVTVDWDQDGKVTCQAAPGEFIETSGAAPMWINKVTRFHKTIGNLAGMKGN